jgi:nicotinate-nucleotide adenylyltransferase
MAHLAESIRRFRALHETHNASYDQGYSAAGREAEPADLAIKDREAFDRGWEAGTKRKQIGLYGGTFNPIHKGHIAVAHAAKKALGLDTVLLVPSAQPPHKPGREVAAADDRLAMTRLAAAGEPGLEVTDIEHRRTGPSYTVDTVRAFKAEHPDSEMFFIIGSDSVPYLHKWREIDELKKLVTFAVASRGERDFEADLANNVAGVKLVRIPLENPSDISSTRVRELAAAGQGLDDLPPAVAEFVRKKGLYGVGVKTHAESLFARVSGALRFDSALDDLDSRHFS